MRERTEKLYKEEFRLRLFDKILFQKLTKMSLGQVTISNTREKKVQRNKRNEKVIKRMGQGGRERESERREGD